MCIMLFFKCNKGIPYVSVRWRVLVPEIYFDFYLYDITMSAIRRIRLLYTIYNLSINYSI